jgi:hypothetical protein
MKRQPFILPRAFALGALLLFLALVPAPSHAAGGPHRVGVIYYGGEWENLLDGLRQGLRELGIEEGKHIVLDVRDAKGDLKAVEAAARALVGHHRGAAGHDPGPPRVLRLRTAKQIGVALPQNVLLRADRVVE